MIEEQKRFRMLTVVNGLEIVTGETNQVNVVIGHEHDEQQTPINAYSGDDPYITLVSDTTPDGRTWTGVHNSYASLKGAVEGHGNTTLTGIENSDSIRHSIRIKKMVTAWRAL